MQTPLLAAKPVATPKRTSPRRPRGFFNRKRQLGIPAKWWRWAAIAMAYAVLHDLGLFDSLLFAAGGGGEEGGGHGEELAQVLLGIITILFVAKIGGDVFERIGMPAVLGELSVGVLIGNWAFLTGEFFSPGVAHAFDFLDPEGNAGHILLILSEIGVVLLLFEVGLESRVADMFSVGTSALLVALLGVVAPIGLGYLSGILVIPDQSWQVHLFIGATLCATSVGITARVLKDLGQSQRAESRIILGAAVIDDVLGLVVLAIVSKVIEQGEVSGGELGTVIGLALGFLAVAMILGAIKLPKFLFKAACRLRGHGLLVTTALIICFGFSWAADLVGLAPIIGAFAAGLILEQAQFEQEGQMHELEEAIAPLSALLVPIFFVEMGMAVTLSSFADSSVWLLAITITVMAIIGKQVCSLGVLEPGMNKLAIGLGMIPRGEVGLIFAGVGRKLVTPEGDSVVSESTYSAIVVMVMITTMITPPLLQWSLLKKGQPTPDEDSFEPPLPPPGEGGAIT